jgi:hypothetical protein
MPTTVNVQFNAEEILKSRGLGENGKAQVFFTNEVYKLSQPYTPFDTGTLAATVDLTPDSITYKVPYARYQYYGVSKNGKSFNYGGAPMRGSFWTNRMWSNRGEEVLQAIANMVGGKVT